MRNFIFLLMLVGLGYGGLRYYGVIGGTEVRPAESPAAEAGAERIETAESPASAPTEPERAISETLAKAAQLLAAGQPLGDLTPSVTERAGKADAPDSDLAGKLLAVETGNPKQRWIAASACALEPRLELEVRDAFASRAVEFAKAGVLASSTVRYRVAKGDSLEKICKKVGKEQSIVTTPGMLRWLNGISGDRIKPDQELVLPPAALRITVSKSRFRLHAWVGDGIVRTYRVAIGRDEKTPVATFKVDDKLEKPPWDDPTTGKRLHYGEPGYALGTRWMAFDTVDGHAGLGIHGTDDPGSIGTKASLGCVRLANGDVEDLYALVPIGTVVEIKG